MENNSYIYVYDFPQKNFSMCHGTYSPIPDPSKNWSVKGALHIRKYFIKATILTINYYIKQVILSDYSVGVNSVHESG